MKPKAGLFLALALLGAVAAWIAWRASPATWLRGAGAAGNAANNASDAHDGTARSVATSDGTAGAASDGVGAVASDDSRRDAARAAANAGERAAGGGAGRVAAQASRQHRGASAIRPRGTAGDAALASVAALARQRAEQALGRFSPSTPLDAATRQKLIDAIVESQLENTDILRMTLEQGLTAAQTSGLRPASARQLIKDIVTLLGPQQGQDFIEVLNSGMFVPLAHDFASRCAALGEPLPPETVSAIAIDLSKNLRNPAFPSPAPTLPNGVPSNEAAAMKLAAQVLTPAQLRAFKQYWAEHPYPAPGT